MNIQECFEYQVHQYPQRVALTYNDINLTYQQLNQHANQLAHYLRVEKKIKKGDFVGICLERSINLIVSILATLKVGATYIPLDPHSPNQRLNHILENCNLKFILLENATLNGIEPILSRELSITNLDKDSANINHHSCENLCSVTAITDNAYVIYTSGTTGIPNGVLVSHENVLRLFAVTQQEILFDKTDVWTLFHSYAFDFSVWEIWGALLFGGRLVVVSYWVSRSPEEFYQLLLKENVTILSQTPSAFEQLIQIDSPLDTFLPLKKVIFGGEQLHIPKLKTWIKKYGTEKPTLYNMYGITETTVHATCYKIPEEAIHNEYSIIGKPLADLSIYLLDEHLSQVATGEIGEIFITGKGVTNGYLNNSSLTRKKFVPNNMDNTSELMYRSGDLAKYLDSGEIVYAGRVDDQVKLRGHRIELDEIKSVLLRQIEIDSAEVLLVSKNEIDFIAAFIIANDVLDKKELRRVLRNYLPEYMCPSKIIFLKHFPLTINGKIDKGELLAMLDTTKSFDNEKTIEITKKIIADTLDISIAEIDETDSFFDLGGNSLLAIDLMTSIENILGIKLNIRDILIGNIKDLIEKAIEFRLALENSTQRIHEPAESV